MSEVLGQGRGIDVNRTVDRYLAGIGHELKALMVAGMREGSEYTASELLEQFRLLQSGGSEGSDEYQPPVFRGSSALPCQYVDHSLRPAGLVDSRDGGDNRVYYWATPTQVQVGEAWEGRLLEFSEANPHLPLSLLLGRPTKGELRTPFTRFAIAEALTSIGPDELVTVRQLNDSMAERRDVDFVTDNTLRNVISLANAGVIERWADPLASGSAPSGTRGGGPRLQVLAGDARWKTSSEVRLLPTAREPLAGLVNTIGRLAAHDEGELTAGRAALHATLGRTESVRSLVEGAVAASTSIDSKTFDERVSLILRTVQEANMLDRWVTGATIADTVARTCPENITRSYVMILLGKMAARGMFLSRRNESAHGTPLEFLRISEDKPRAVVDLGAHSIGIGSSESREYPTQLGVSLRQEGEPVQISDVVAALDEPSAIDPGSSGIYFQAPEGKRRLGFGPSKVPVEVAHAVACSTDMKFLEPASVGR